MTPLDYSRARRLLRRDPVMAALIREHGPCGLADALRVDHLSALVRAIIFQQLSTKAASTIHGRLVGLLPDGRITAAALAEMTDEQFRSVGVSRQKARYLRDLAGKVSSREVTLDGLEDLDDESVIAALTAVKGIGRWTAEMFLMFRLHRPDVLPVGDLGIVNAVQKAYGLRKRPTPDRLRRLGDAWKPYRSVACWYLWRSLDNAGGSRLASRRSRSDQGNAANDATCRIARAAIVPRRRVVARRSSARPRRQRRRKVGRRRRPRPGSRSWRSTRPKGTWMNVDVSPDGKRIVFDLLGDIYIMPIDGSGAAPATRLTSGPAFDMQPRFSPDGKRIAISQRSRRPVEHLDDGRRTGKDPKQVSRERRWFVNSPTWSPDGEYIYARRHFVKERSLGAGEIWMYHASGASDGLQVTERTGWQKDNGEPDVSPDGRYLYYSKDVTPGHDLRIQQGSERHDLRRDAPRSHDRPRAPRGQRAGRIGRAAGVARRQDARLRPPRPAEELRCTCAISRAVAIASCSATSTRICRRRGRSTACIRNTPGRPTAARS